MEMKRGLRVSLTVLLSVALFVGAGMSVASSAQAHGSIQTTECSPPHLVASKAALVSSVISVSGTCFFANQAVTVVVYKDGSTRGQGTPFTTDENGAFSGSVSPYCAYVSVKVQAWQWSPDGYLVWSPAVTLNS